jgi:hypothetical protein
MSFDYFTKRAVTQHEPRRQCFLNLRIISLREKVRVVDVAYLVKTTPYELRLSTRLSRQLLTVRLPTCSLLLPALDGSVSYLSYLAVFDWPSRGQRVNIGKVGVNDKKRLGVKARVTPDNRDGSGWDSNYEVAVGCIHL